MLWCFIKLRRFGMVVCLSGALTATAGAQQLPPAMPRFEIRWTDYAAIGVLGTAAVLPTLLADHLPHATCAPCDPSGLWGIDRGTIGEPRSGPAAASDVTLLATFFGGAALLAHARAGQPSQAKWEDVTVYTQSVLATAAVTEWTKVLFQRPRPPRYTANAANYLDPDYGKSFPSGHAAFSFAAASSYASILSQRGEAGRHKGEIVLLFTTAAATSILRVSAHKHFPTDVMAGAVLGTTVGWFVPRIHRTQ